MARRELISTATAEAIRRVAAALAAGLPPPEEVTPRPAGTRCIHAHDTGGPAFAGLPCRGNRIECRKTGVVTYAANCRPDKCISYEEGQGS